MDKVYIVRVVRDTNYGFRGISGVYASREAAQRFIDSIGGHGFIRLCSGEDIPMYTIECWETKNR